MSSKRGFFAILITAILLVGLHRISYYHARRSLYRSFPGLSDAPAVRNAGLAIHPGPGIRIAWIFNFYQDLSIPSRGEVCETSQMWVSLTGRILETSPKGQGVADWIRCVREDAS